MTITRMDPLSFAKLMGAVYALGGLIAGLFMFVFSTLAGTLTGAGQGTGMMALGAGSIIVFPLLYGAIGFVGSLAFAGLYNVLAKNIGGIKIEVS